MIKKIYINNFGKFNNYELEFEKGLNVIYGQNEAGKTTILNFILMILYGNQSKSKDILQNERKKYRPWNNDIMKGFIEIEKNCIPYKIERTFLNSNATDIVSIYNMNTGENIEIPDSKVPGEYFFGLGYEALKKILFISSEEIVIDNDNKKDEITRKLVNLVTTGKEDISYKKSIDRLDEKIYALKSKSGKQGELVEINDNIDKIKLEMEIALEDEKEKEKLSEKISKLQSEKEKLKSKLDKAENIITKKDERQEILYTRKDFESNLDKLDNSLDIRELKFIEEKIGEVKNKSSLFNITLGDISILLFFFSLFLIRKNFYLFSIIALLSIVIYVVNYLKKENNKKEIINDLVNTKNQLIEKIQRIDRLRKDNENEIYYIDRAIEEIDLYFNDEDIDYTMFGYKDIEKINDKIYEINNEITSIKSMSKERYSGRKNYSTLEYELSKLNEKREKIEKKYELLKITKSLIVKSLDEFQNIFSVKLNDLASNTIEKITNGKYSKLYVDKNFSIKVEDSESRDLIDWKYLSSGTIDQFYLSLRLSLADLIIEDVEKRILFVDDIFIRFDKIRMNNTIDILMRDDSGLDQILMFTSKKMDMKDISHNLIEI